MPVPLLFSTVICLIFLTGWQILSLGGAASNKTPSLLQSAVNPNTASWASLTRLPGVGPARAEKIISYREQYLLHRHARLPFANIESMRKIKGFGPVTLRNLAPYLRFGGGRVKTHSGGTIVHRGE